MFLIRGEIGADWCTPVLQHPYCVLRHLKPSYDSALGYNSDCISFKTFIVFYLGPNVKEFCNMFKSLGLIPGVNSWSAILPINLPNFNILQQQVQFSSQPLVDFVNDDNGLEEVVSALCDMGKGN